MQEKPTVEPCGEAEPPAEDKTASLGEDQMKRPYYYDDAHGYEEYDPDEEGSDDEAGTKGSSSPSENLC